MLIGSIVKTRFPQVDNNCSFMMDTLGSVILFCLLLYVWIFPQKSFFVCHFRDELLCFRLTFSRYSLLRISLLRFLESLHPQAKLLGKGIKDLKLINAFGKRYSRCAFVTWTLAFRQICNLTDSVKSWLANLWSFLEGHVVAAYHGTRIISHALYLPFLLRLPITLTPVIRSPHFTDEEMEGQMVTSVNHLPCVQYWANNCFKWTCSFYPFAPVRGKHFIVPIL